MSRSRAHVLSLLGLAALGCASRSPGPAGAGATAAPATAAPTPAAATPGEPPPSVLLPASAEPTIAVAAWLQVGSLDDPPGKEGLAWLTANMIARGATQKHRYDEILRLLYPMAASYEASVDREMTVLSGRVHRDHAAAYLDLFADAFTRPAFDAADFERLRAEALAYVEKELRYALDEELGKAALQQSLFHGTGYAHPPEGLAASLGAITLEDVRAFWQAHYTADRLVFGLSGGWNDEVRSALESSRRALPARAAAARPEAPAAVKPQGRRVLLIDKPGADASISFGFPIEVRRGHPDFAALYLAASWLGEHRNSSSHLYKVIRERRGLNYGDYAYVEAYPGGGFRQLPPANVARRRQSFEVWLRTLPSENAVFALRAALRELDRLLTEGLSQEQFELTRNFLMSYTLHFTPSSASQLLWALDDRFYGLPRPHLEALRDRLKTLTREEVNDALRRHLSTRDMVIAIATGKPDLLRQQLTSGSPTPPTYATPKPPEVLAEDRQIQSYPLGIEAAAITVLPVQEMFTRPSRAGEK